MQNILYVVEVDQSLSEYAQRLVALIKARGVDAESCTLKQFKKMIPFADTVYKGSLYIFLGTDLWGDSAVSGISEWRYNRFGCRIGWVENNCVLSALSLKLPYSEYQAFREHCKEAQLEHTDVVVPPENPLAEAGEYIKEITGKKENISVCRAQYSVLIYEFMDNYFESFWEAGSLTDPADEKADGGMKDHMHKIKKAALLNLTKGQAIRCHAVIHTCAAGCTAAAFIPVPVADAVPITAAQISMVIALGKIFGNKLTKPDAKILLQTALAPLAGRTLSKGIFMFMPGAGWAINGGIAAAITESLGWSIARDFALKSKDSQS